MKGGIRLQDMRVNNEKVNPNTVVGKENKETVLNKLGLVTPVIKTIKYVTRNGVPCKLINGVFFPLTKVTK